MSDTHLLNGISAQVFLRPGGRGRRSGHRPVVRVPLGRPSDVIQLRVHRVGRQGQATAGLIYRGLRPAPGSRPSATPLAPAEDAQWLARRSTRRRRARTRPRA